MCLWNDNDQPREHPCFEIGRLYLNCFFFCGDGREFERRGGTRESINRASESLSHCVLTSQCCVQFAKIETKKREVWLRHFWYFVATPENVCVFGKRGAAELMFFTISHSRRYFVILSCAYGPRMVN